MSGRHPQLQPELTNHPLHQSLLCLSDHDANKRNAAACYASHNVRINCVAPGARARERGIESGAGRLPARALVHSETATHRDTRKNQHHHHCHHPQTHAANTLQSSGNTMNKQGLIKSPASGELSLDPEMERLSK